MDAVTHVPAPANEPVLDYAPGSPERAALEVALAELGGDQTELPHTIDGERVMGTGRRIAVRQPHAHRKVLGTHAQRHRQARARPPSTRPRPPPPSWRELSFDDRAAILLKAAELLSGPWRARLNAATMLGQSKTAYQAEIDAACELIDFWRINVHFARQILERAAAAQRQGHLEPHRTTARSRASSTRSRRSTSPPSPATCRPPRRSWATPSCGSRRPTQQLAAQLTMELLEEAGHAARRHQPGDRRRPQRLQGRARRPGPRRHPLHRLDPDVPAPVARGRRQPRRATAPTRGSSARPAARTSSSPTRAPTPTCCAPR